MKESQYSTNYNKVILILSVFIPVAVAGLYFIVPKLGFGSNNEMRFLGGVNAVINSLTAILLLFAVTAVRKGNVKLHKTLMLSSIGLGALFLVSYVIMHATTEPVPYQGEGNIAIVYYFLLITHILLSIVVLPFVLVTLARALNGNIENHKKIAKIAFPIWFYVSVSGVIVYFMISPYY